jgi:serine/threonine protein kinase
LSASVGEVDGRGRVQIADFGLAKLVGRTPIDISLTATGQVLGTYRYMAPEQIERPLSVDHRADIHSLGVVLYELLTGELPLGRFALPSERGTDAGLDRVVLRALEPSLASARWGSRTRG